MVPARREKHRFGGAMRQAGIAAAAGLYALDHNVERLADDHARARRLGEAWAAAGLPVDLALVETNFVQLDVASARSRRVGGGRVCCATPACSLSRTMKPGVLRAVTHLDVDDDDIGGAARARARRARSRVGAA